MSQFNQGPRPPGGTSAEQQDILSGGISQQPPHLRFPNQVEDAHDVRFNVVSGASKRPGSFFDRVIDGHTDKTDLRLHAIDRDGAERYLVIYGPGVFEAYELYGKKVDLTIPSAVQAYLDSGSPTSSQIKLVTVADTTFVLNTTVTAAALDQSANFTVSREHYDYDAMIATTPADGSYHRTLNDTASVAAGYWQYNAPSGSTAAQWVWETGDIKNRKNWGVPSTWQKAKINPLGLAARLRRQGISITDGSYDADDAAESNKTTFESTGAFTDYVWQDGDELMLKDWLEVSVQGATTDTIDAWVRIKSRISDDKIEIDTTKPARTAEQYNPNGAQVIVTIDYPHSYPSASDSTTDAEGIYRRYEMEYDWNATPPSSMEDITNRIQTEFRNAGLEGLLVSWEETGLNGKGRMTVTSPWRGSQSEIVGFYKPESDTIRRSLSGDDRVLDDENISISDYNNTSLSNHPFQYQDGTHTKGTGDQELEVFDPEESSWVPQTAPGESYGKLDAATLPVRLERTAVSVTATAEAAAFEMSQVPWVDRLSGGNDDNPVLSLFSEGWTITDIGFLQNRLVMGGGPHLAFSGTGDIYNFFKPNVADPKDSDCFGARLGGDGRQVSLVQSITPVRDTLMVMTRNGRQYDVYGGEALTADTVDIKLSGHYPAVDLPMVVPDHRAYFLTVEGGAGQVREYVYAEQYVANEAERLTRHVPTFLPDELRRLDASVDGEILFVLGEEGDKIYTHTQAYSGNERVQTAWQDDTIPAGLQVRDIAVLGDQLWMLARDRESGAWMLLRHPVVVDPPVSESDSQWLGYSQQGATRFFRATDYDTASLSNIYVKLTEDPSGSTTQYADHLDRTYTIDTRSCYSRQPPESAEGVTSTLIAAPPSWPDPLYSGAQSIANDSTYVWETESGDTTYRVELTDYDDERLWVYSEAIDPVTFTNANSDVYSTSSAADVTMVAWEKEIYGGSTDEVVYITAENLPLVSQSPTRWQGTGTWRYVSPTKDVTVVGVGVRVDRSGGNFTISADVQSQDFADGTIPSGYDPYFNSSGQGSGDQDGWSATSGGGSVTITIENNTDTITKYWTQPTGSGPIGEYSLRDDGIGNTYDVDGSPSTTDITDSSS